MTVSARSVSVVVPAYNASQTLGRCVRSVLDTGYPDLEIIIVDDRSTDDTSTVAEGLIEEFGPMVKLIRQQQNGGPAKARNAGARLATSDLIFFLDSDTRMHADALDKFVVAMEGADAVSGTYSAAPLNRGLVPAYKALLNNYFFCRRGVIGYEVLDSSRAGMRADLFRELGGFNENLAWGMDYENEEFGYRISENHRLVLDPSIQVDHVFPGFGKLTRTYFLRVAFWMEVFVRRRRFESGGVASAETGLASAALLAAIALLVVAIAGWTLGLVDASWALVAILPFIVYAYGYGGFFGFVLQRRPLLLPAMAALNLYFTLVIGCGAAYGLVRAVLGKSETEVFAR